MTGQIQHGLDSPGRPSHASAVPGSPGHTATNAIDRYGALDPNGLTIDGNNAAGLPKTQKLAAATPFTVKPLYEPRTDSLAVYLEDTPSYASPVGDNVTVFKSQADDVRGDGGDLHVSELTTLRTPV